MARQQDDVMDGLRREFKRQLSGFPRGQVPAPRLRPGGQAPARQRLG
jgi:hypothetical protein